MTRTRKRTRRSHDAAPAAVHTAASASPLNVAEPVPLPEWKWRTFPVYFVGSLGLFVGVYAGWISGFIASDSGNQNPTTVAFLGSAVIFAFGLSRLTTRFLISRRWVKPRPRK